MKPYESPRIRKKSIRGDSGDSWPVWNRGITACSIQVSLNKTIKQKQPTTLKFKMNSSNWKMWDYPFGIHGLIGLDV